MSIRLIFRFSKSNKPQTEQLQKLIFDETGKSQIFFHRNGQENLRWALRGTTLFTLLNTFLGVSEAVLPIFGGWNGISFGFSSMLGFGALIALNIISKRTVSDIKLLKSGDFVEIKYFNAFWTPQVQTIHVSEFAELQPSFLGYHRVELTSIGKIWINLEKNQSVNPQLGYDIMTAILSGNPVKIDALKYKRKYQKD